MKCSYSCPQGVLYAWPKLGGEPRIPIRDNGYWNPVEPYNLIYVNLGCLSTKSVIFMGKNSANFIKWSTMTHITSFPFLPMGNPDAKSMVIISHFHFGICNGCNGSVGLWCSNFDLLTYFAL